MAAAIDWFGTFNDITRYFDAVNPDATAIASGFVKYFLRDESLKKAVPAAISATLNALEIPPDSPEALVFANKITSALRGAIEMNNPDFYFFDRLDYERVTFVDSQNIGKKASGLLRNSGASGIGDYMERIWPLVSEPEVWNDVIDYHFWSIFDDETVTELQRSISFCYFLAYMKRGNKESVDFETVDFLPGGENLFIIIHRVTAAQAAAAAAAAGRYNNGVYHHYYLNSDVCDICVIELVVDADQGYPSREADDYLVALLTLLMQRCRPDIADNVSMMSMDAYRWMPGSIANNGLYEEIHRFLASFPMSQGGELAGLPSFGIAPHLGLRTRTVIINRL